MNQSELAFILLVCGDFLGVEGGVTVRGEMESIVRRIEVFLGGNQGATCFKLSSFSNFVVIEPQDTFPMSIPDNLVESNNHNNGI